MISKTVSTGLNSPTAAVDSVASSPNFPGLIVAKFTLTLVVTLTRLTQIKGPSQIPILDFGGYLEIKSQETTVLGIVNHVGVEKKYSIKDRQLSFYLIEIC